jgi:hypothetical protein
MRLPEAYRSLPRPSSSLKPSHPPDGVSASDESSCKSLRTHFPPVESTQLYVAIIVNKFTTPFTLQVPCRVASRQLRVVCILRSLTVLALSKEVIRPQVPLRPPCYDFSPLAELRFDTVN